MDGPSTTHMSEQPVRTGSRYRYAKRRYRILFGIFDSICAPLFRLARSLRTTPEIKDPKSILIVQLDHVGDAVLTTPMLRALHDRFPNAQIDILGSEWNQEVFHSIPYVRTVHISQCNWQSRDPARQSHLGEVIRQANRMRRNGYDLGIDPRGDFLITLLLWLAGIPRRLGWSSGGGGFLLTDVPPWNALRHEVDSRLALLEPLAIETDQRETYLDPGWPERYRVREGLAALPESGPLVVVHISAGTAAKRWPVAYLTELADRLEAEYGAQIVLVGDEHEVVRSRVIVRTNPRVIDWTGQLKLMELAALLEEADVFVGADSGPAHIASSVGTPSVVLFSGTNRAGRWRPTGSRVEVVRWPVPCSPCHLKECPVSGHPCMTGIRPSDVMAAISRVAGDMRRSRSSFKTQELLLTQKEFEDRDENRRNA